MYAIAINSQTIPKILEKKIHPKIDKTYLTVYSAFDRNRYVFIQGYVNRYGSYIDFIVLPTYIVRDDFVVTADTLETDWTDIYRKAPDALW